jgi:hypothetical protein
MFSLNYTLQILRIKSFLHSRLYRTELSTGLCTAPYHEGFVSWIHGFSATSNYDWFLVKSKSKSCYDRRFRRPVRLEVKHPSGAEDQIFITVGQLQACWCGALSLTRERVCRLPDSVSSIKSFVSMYSFILQLIKCMYIQHIQGLCQFRLSTAENALFLVAPATIAV